MRRTGALILCLLTFCALPSIAYALTHTISWHSKTSSATIYIGYKIRNAKPKVIITFEFNNIPASCPGYASTAVSDTFSQHIKVGPGPRWRFHATESVNSGKATYAVRGRFLTLHKARGTLRVTGTVPGCKDADTGLVAWTARRKG
jgi:hypothetical protein